MDKINSAPMFSRLPSSMWRVNLIIKLFFGSVEYVYEKSTRHETALLLYLIFCRLRRFTRDNLCNGLLHLLVNNNNCYYVMFSKKYLQKYLSTMFLSITCVRVRLIYSSSYTVLAYRCIKLTTRLYNRCNLQYIFKV